MSDSPGWVLPVLALVLAVVFIVGILLRRKYPPTAVTLQHVAHPNPHFPALQSSNLLLIFRLTVTDVSAENAQWHQ